MLGSSDTRKCSGERSLAQSTFSENCGRGVYRYMHLATGLQTFPIAVNRFECLSWFNGVLLSGQVKVLKPDRRIFEIFLDTFRIEPSRAIYIDDTSENVEMSVQLGMRGVVFRDSAGLRTELTQTGLLVDKIQGRLL